MCLAAALAAFASCEKESNEPKGEPAESVEIDTRAYDKWTYFSFDKGVVAEPADFTDNTDWDLAFHRWDVRTNGGASGKGQGGAYMLEQTSLDDLPAPDAALLKSDGTILTYMKVPDMTGENNQRVEVPASTELGQWMHVAMGTTPPTYAMLHNVFVVRAADGRFAAIRFLNYMNDKAEKGHVRFEYVFPIR